MWNNDDEHKLPGVIFCYSEVWCDLILARGWSPPPVRSWAHQQQLESSPLKASVRKTCLHRNSPSSEDWQVTENEYHVWELHVDFKSLQLCCHTCSLPSGKPGKLSF